MVASLPLSLLSRASAETGPPGPKRLQVSYGATVDVDWGTRDDAALAVAANFWVKVNGVRLDPPAANQPSGVWTTLGTPFRADPGPNDVTVELDWDDTTTNPPRFWGALKCTKSQNPCRYDGPVENVHRAFVGTRANAGAVELVRTSGNTFSAGLPGPPLDNVADGGATRAVFPTLGIRAVLKVGQLTTLRLDDPQANQTLRCDPDYAQGQEFKAFESGCKRTVVSSTKRERTKALLCVLCAKIKSTGRDGFLCRMPSSMTIEASSM